MVTFFAAGFPITYKNLIVSLYLAFFLQWELHTLVPGYIDFSGCKYQRGINIKKYKCQYHKYQPLCKDKSVEVNEQIRKPTYS